MLNSAIIEVIIGLIFVFSLTSVIVTQINSVIISVFNLRARHLRTGIEGMLTDPVVRTKFLAHPLIRLISPEITPDERLSAQAADDANTGEALRVTSIPPTLFSQALIDVISATASIDLYAQFEETIERDLDGGEKAQMRELVRRLQAGGVGITEVRNAIGTIANARDRYNLVQALAKLETMRNDLQANNESSRLIPLLEGVRHIENYFFRKGIETLLAPARTLDDASARIEFWFNARMEQMTLEYRRRMAVLSLIVGLVLTVMLNVDTLYLARTLWDDPALRATVALSAQQAVDSGQLQTQIQEVQDIIQFPSTPTPEPTPEPTPFPTFDPALIVPPMEGSDTTVLPTDGLAGMSAPEAGMAFSAPAGALGIAPEFGLGEAIEEADRVSDTVFTLLNLRLPLGWDYTPIASGCPSPEALIPDPCSEGRNLWTFIPGNTPDWLGNILVKLLGWALTTIAISQGAPFWFDLLNRIARGRREEM